MWREEHMEMRRKVDLMAWISTGEIAGIVPGDHKRKVVDAFGSPEGWCSTEDPGEIDDFMVADMWGHGVWATYFEGDVLDAVSCGISALNEAGWYFDMEKIPTSFFDSIDEAEKILVGLGIPCVRVPKFYYIKDVVTGAISQRKRRLVIPTILAGNELKTRMVFDDDGRMKIIANPVGLRRQIVGYGALDVDKTYVYIHANEVPNDHK